MRPMVGAAVRLLAGALGLLGGSVHAFTAEHYAVEIRPDFGRQLLEGRAAIRLIAEGGERAIDLGAPTLQVQAVRLDGRARRVERDGSGWHVALDHADVPATVHALEVDYLAPAADGLAFGDGVVYTAFRTCAWLPCVGSDLDRSTARIALHLPQGDRSVASGRRLAESVEGGQRWEQSTPVPLYTLGFAAGRFEARTDAADPRLRYLVVPAAAASAPRMFADSARMLAFFEAHAGVALPAAGYTQVLVAGDVAQEASSFSMIGRDVLDPILEDPQEDWAIAHEMAHQWWGNLVTCADWHELWLNEGLAVFMTAAWKQQRWGDAAYAREMDLARRRWQRAKDAGVDRPLSWAGEYPSLSLRRAIQYSKATLFLDALRIELGDAAFWDGLRLYTRDNAGRAVRSRDLQAAMEASAGRRLDALFDAWVR